jgi:hypothetical protein
LPKNWVLSKFVKKAVMLDGKHQDGRATTIPIHGNTDIGGWLFYEIPEQLGITEEEFKQWQ